MCTHSDEPDGVAWPPEVVCFGGEDWWYHNRGHCDIQFMRQYARHGRVIYVNSVVMRKFNVSEGAMFWQRLLRKAKSIMRGLVRIEDNFWVYSPVTAPVHHLSLARPINARFLREQMRLVTRRLRFKRPLLWVNCPAACDAALALPRTALVYQRTDRFEDHPGVDVAQITRYDRRLKREADVTFYSNYDFYKDEVNECRNAIYVEHGVDYDLFASAADAPEIPDELRQVDGRIVGFFGGIDSHKFNMELVADVVRKLPDATFAFVGQPSIDTSVLESQPNVVMVGQQPYERIPHYGKCFDVCILPFNRNRWIDAMTPIKLKEYLALGKPVVATPFGELRKYEGLVRIAEDADAFVAAVREAFDDTSSEAAAMRRERVTPHSWRSKAVEVLTAIQDRHGHLPRQAPALAANP